MPGDYDYRYAPPPPEDLEEQASAVRQAAEIAALGLFVHAAMEDDEPNGADVALIRRIFGEVVAGIVVNALTSAGTGPDRRVSEPLSPVSTTADSIAERLAHRNSLSISRLIKMVQAIRRSNRDAKPRDPGELSLARESARNFATWAYGQAIEDVAPILVDEKPGWLSPSLVLKKTWITMHDTRVRPLHRRLHAKTVSMDKPFWRWIGTGQELRFPGDPTAPLDAVIGCRCICWLSWSKADELASVIRALPPLE